MSYAIVFSSKTGNTALLAQTLQEQLPQADCLLLPLPLLRPPRPRLLRQKLLPPLRQRQRLPRPTKLLRRSNPVP